MDIKDKDNKEEDFIKEEDFVKFMQEFYNDLMGKQKDLPSDIAKVIADNLWELYESEESIDKDEKV